MPQYTSNMDLYKVDLETDGNSTFNIKTMLNDNWDKIDSKYDEHEGRIRGNSEVVNEVKEDVGDKSELKTEDKSSLVGAVNEVSEGMADIAYKQATIADREIKLTVPSFTFTNNKYISVEITADILEGNVLTVKVNSDTAIALKDTDNNPLTSLDKGFYTIIARTGTPNFFLLAPKGAGIQSIYGAYDGSNVITVAEKVKKGQYVYGNHDIWLDDELVVKSYKLNDVNSSHLSVTDNYVFYRNNSEGGAIYRIKHDGTDNIKLNSVASVYLFATANYIFYVNQSDVNKLYRMNIDGTNNIKLNDINSGFISATDNYVFYRNVDDGGAIYRMKHDGTDNIKLNSASSNELLVTDDYLFYIVVGYLHLYRMNHDGTNNIRISNILTSAFSVIGNYIFYENRSDGNKLYRMNIDGTDNIKLNDSISNYISANRYYVYYSNGGDNNTLYRMKYDGTDNIKIVDTSMTHTITKNNLVFYTVLSRSFLYKYIDTIVIPSIENGKDNQTLEFSQSSGYYLVADNNYIFYENRKDGSKLYRSNIDGSNEIKLNDFQSRYLTLIDDYVFYQNLSDNSYLYRIKKDGTGNIKLNNNSTSGIVSHGNTIFFANPSDGSSIYSISIDGTNETKLNSTASAYIVLNDTHIFYRNITDGGAIYRMNHDGSNNIKLVDVNAYYLSLISNYVFYKNNSDGGKLCRVNIDGTNNIKINNADSSFIHATNNYVFYKNNDDGGKLYRVNIDGTHVMKINDSILYYITTNDNYLFYSDAESDSIKRINYQISLDTQFQAPYTGTLKSYGTDPQQITGFISKKPIGWSKVDLVPKVKIISGTRISTGSSSSVRQKFPTQQGHDSNYTYSYVTFNFGSDFTPHKIIIYNTTKSTTTIWSLQNLRYDSATQYANCLFAGGGHTEDTFRIPYKSSDLRIPVTEYSTTYNYVAYGGE